MQKSEIRKTVDDFLNNVREPLEKGLADGTIKPIEIEAVLSQIQKEEGLPALGRRIAKEAMGDGSGSEASEDELEALGQDIAKHANGGE